MRRAEPRTRSAPSGDETDFADPESGQESEVDDLDEQAAAESPVDASLRVQLERLAAMFQTGRGEPAAAAPAEAVRAAQRRSRRSER